MKILIQTFIKLSDHNLITIEIHKSEEIKKGKGFWKFNSSFLKDINYVILIKNRIQEIMDRYKMVENKNMVWEFLKLVIRNESVMYAINKKRKDMELENSYKKRHTELYNKEYEIC